MASVSKYSDMTSLELTKLCLAADYYAEVSPALARFFTDKVDRIKERSGLPPTASHLRCQFCGAVFRPGNHHSHVKAQMKETRKIQQLQRHDETPGCRLGRFQRRLLDMYANRKNRLTIVCEVCNKRTRVWFPGEREKGAKGTCEEILVPDTSKMSRSAKKKLKKKLKKKKQQSEGGLTPDVARLTATSTSSTPLSSSVSRIRSTPSSGSHSTPLSRPHSTKSHAASSQSKTTANTPSGGPARNKKKRNKQSYNPLKEMLERQSTDKSKTSGKGIMDLLMNMNK